jgi:succinate dehydrogenase / fumarate reductase iron-sulfur subunit
VTGLADPTGLALRVLRVRRTARDDGDVRWSTFEVPVPSPRTTVLDALTWARRHLDPTIDIRHSCLHASCGTCAMRVNGREALACVTPLEGLPNRPIVVEPLRGLDVVSDLVVDLEAVYEALDEVGRPLQRADETASEALRADEAPTRFEDCIECGACVSACPIAADDAAYAGPPALAAAWRVVAEPRDVDVAGAVQLADGDQGAWRCHLAFECTAACPVDARPAQAIMRLRGTLLRRRIGRGLGRRAGATHAMEARR